MIKNQLPKILMVSTEYPPMRGGVGRYTFNLVRQLRKKGMHVLVASNEEGDGDFFGLAPANNENYRVLLKIVDEIQLILFIFNTNMTLWVSVGST
jgi:glycosyltransferase involved in cell wall biosynthesis